MIRLLCLARNTTIFILIFGLFACNSAKKTSQDYVYFQRGLDSLGHVQFRELTIQPNDLLSIFVFSKSLNQDQAALFNMAGSQGLGGATTTGTTSGTAGSAQGYLVASDGKIEMPILGLINAVGLTRLQLQNEIRERLLPYVKDPSVIVRFQNFSINVLGEVKTPGTKTFITDKVTLIDAISAAGDLTEAGKRQDVTVIREEKDGKRKLYKVDLRSAGLFESPVFQLQQNDIVYVGPTKVKLKSVGEKPDLTPIQLGLSFLSIAATLILLFKRI